jgi:hypothetical protein
MYNVIIFYTLLLSGIMHESIPGVTIPPPWEHTRAFDLIGHESVNARVPGHNLKTNARPLGKLRVENAPPRGRFYNRFHETLTTNVPNFVAKFASSLRSSEAHIGIHKPICKQSPWLVREVKEANQMRSLRTGLWISLWTFELRNNLVNFAKKFGKFVVKKSTVNVN